MSIQPQYVVFAILGIVSLVILTLSILAIRKSWSYDDLLPGVGVMVSGLLLIVSVLIFIPFNSYFFYNYTETGKVTQINSAITEGRDSTDVFSVTLSGHKSLFVLDDIRIKADEGKNVTLLCGPQWVYQAQPILNCSIVSVNN